MIRFLLGFLLSLILMTATTVAQSPVVGGNGTPVAESALTLPADGNQWYTSVFLDSRADNTIPSWFDTNPTLARLKYQTHFNVVYRTDPQWSKYAPTVPVLPCVVIQNNKDEVIFKASGDNLAITADALVGQIRSNFIVKAEACSCGSAAGECRCRVCRCPDNCACKRKPATPVPDPAVPDTVPDIFVPDTAPETPVEDTTMQFSFWMSAVIVLVGASAAVVPKIWKKWKSLDPGRTLP